MAHFRFSLSLWCLKFESLITSFPATNNYLMTAASQQSLEIFQYKEKLFNISVNIIMYIFNVYSTPNMKSLVNCPALDTLCSKLHSIYLIP